MIISWSGLHSYSLSYPTFINVISDHLACPPTDPDASPLLANLENLPPAFVQIAGLDPLRDEGILYAKLMKEAGVETKLEM
jgi:acetyl esterase/lipase